MNCELSKTEVLEAKIEALKEAVIKEKTTAREIKDLENAYLNRKVRQKQKGSYIK
jgi:ribosomal protein S6